MAAVVIPGHGIVDASKMVCIPMSEPKEKRTKVERLRSVGRKALRSLGRLPKALNGRKETVSASSSSPEGSPTGSPNTPRWAEIARLSLSRKSKSGKQKRVRFSFFLERGKDRSVLRLSSRSMYSNRQGILKKETEKQDISEYSTKEDVYGVLEKAMEEYGDSDLVREYTHAQYSVAGEEEGGGMEGGGIESPMPVYGDPDEVSYRVIQDSPTGCTYGIIEETWSKMAHCEDSADQLCPEGPGDVGGEKACGRQDNVKRSRGHKGAEVLDVVERGPAQKRPKGGLRESSSAVMRCSNTDDKYKTREKVSFASLETKSLKVSSVGFQDENVLDGRMQVRTKSFDAVVGISEAPTKKKKKWGRKAFWLKKSFKYDSDDELSSSPGTPRHVSDWQ